MGLGFAIDDGPAAVTLNGNLEGSFVDSGSWHFVAVTVDRMDGRVKTYHNAVFQKQSATLTSIDTDVKNDAPFCIGGKLNSDADTGVGNPYNGYIDDVRVYNKVLSESELRAIYLNPGGTKTTKISGDQITTGKLKSNNLSSTEGSVFDLDGGTFKLGGESSPNLSFDGSTLEVDGTISSSVGNIGGWTIDNTSLTAGDTTISSSGLVLMAGPIGGVRGQGFYLQMILQKQHGDLLENLTNAFRNFWETMELQRRIGKFFRPLNQWYLEMQSFLHLNLSTVTWKRRLSRFLNRLKKTKLLSAHKEI